MSFSGSGQELRGVLEHLLLANPSQPARRLATMLQAQGFDVDKGTVNSVLYRHSATFRHDGAVPPRWSLAEAAPPPVERAPHRISGVGLVNWKVFERQELSTGDATLLFGENSAGKSSILQALLLMKQSWGHGSLRWNDRWGSFGWFQHVVHRHDEDRDLTLVAFWRAPQEEDHEWSVLLTAVGIDEENYADEHPISRMRCDAGDEAITLFATDFLDLSEKQQHLAGGWLALRGDLASTTEVTWDQMVQYGQVVVLGRGAHGFPDVDNVLASAVDADGNLPPAVRETLTTMRRVLGAATAMFDAIVHIGPYRTVPDRDIRMSWALMEANYVARLATDDDLLADVNEWLGRFEIPYALEIARYGDDEGDEIFDLNLVRIGGFAERVHLRDVGFGVSQVLPIIAQLLGNREKTILIEEPEAHVHPRLQSVLGDLFMTSMQDYGNVLIVETHSEPILLRMQRRVAEGRLDHEGVAVHHVIRQGTTAHVEAVPIKENGQLDYRWPGGFFDDRMNDLVAILDPRPDE